MGAHFGADFSEVGAHFCSHCPVYADQGVKFKVCGLALKDYGYTPADMQPFVEVTPSAMTELVHWQNQGYGLITPVVTDKKVSIDEIR